MPIVTPLAAWVALCAPARAEDPDPAAVAEPPNTYHDSAFKRFEVGIGLDAGGPLLFRDTPDATLAAPIVFEYGTRLGFRFGDPDLDPHRVGIVVGLQSLARSGDRKLFATDPMVVYATGKATEMQFGLGARVASGSDGFRIADAVPYSGPLASLEVRHSFVDGQAKTPIGVVVGGFFEAVLGTPTSYSTAFAGARLDLTYRQN